MVFLGGLGLGYGRILRSIYNWVTCGWMIYEFWRGFLDDCLKDLLGGLMGLRII